jgi:hypothetical protein
VAQLDHTDAENLLDFVLGVICDGDFDDADMTQRARLFLLKTMSKTHIEAPPDPDDPESYSFPLLLYMLNQDELCVRDTLHLEITLKPI